MGKIVCFSDKDGMVGTCCEEAIGKTVIDCDKCDFKEKFKGREKDEFSYCFWLGEIKD